MELAETKLSVNESSINLFELLSSCDSKYSYANINNIINMYLVYKKARKCCLVRLLPSETDRIISVIANKLGLVVYLEDIRYRSYIIGSAIVIEEFLQQTTGLSRDDDYFKYHEIIGQFLGFRSTGHNWFDYSQKRVTFRIRIVYNDATYEPFCFVCEFKKTNIPETLQYVRELSESFKRVLPDKMTVVPYYEISAGMTARIQALRRRDIIYCKKFYVEYRNDIYNFWIAPSKLSRMFEQSIASREEFYINAETLATYWSKFEDIRSRDEIQKLDQLLQN
jgi:hypothetical protein